jgi:hypothetical protein
MWWTGYAPLARMLLPQHEIQLIFAMLPAY